MLDAFRYGKINKPQDRREIIDFSGLTREIAVRFKEIWQKHGVSKSIEMLDAFRYGKTNKPQHRRENIDFSGLEREMAVRVKEIVQKRGFSKSIEMLEGLLLFPD